MSSKRSRGGVVDSAGTLLPIIGGRPWNARRIPHPILRQNARILGRTFRHDNKWTSYLREPCARLVRVLGERTSLFTECRDIVPLLLRLAAYHKKWVRQPEALDTESNFIEQLLALYPVPAAFQRVWQQPGKLKTFERDAYCHVAQGGSALDLPQPIGKLTKRAAHLLMTEAPGDLSLRAAIRWAQATALGASDRQARIFAESRMNREFANYPAWQQLMEMLLAAKLPHRNLGIVIDHFAQKLHTAWPQEISLKGSSVKDLVNEAESTFSRLLEIAHEQGLHIQEKWLINPSVRSRLLELARQRWNPMQGMRPFRKEIKGTTWEITELCSQYQLDQESRSMHHCVETYAYYCQKLDTAIFSLRSEEDGPVLTIEVESDDREISQVKGRWNRGIYYNEIPIVKAWAKENRLLWESPE